MVQYVCTPHKAKRSKQPHCQLCNTTCNKQPRSDSDSQKSTADANRMTALQAISHRKISTLRNPQQRYRSRHVVILQRGLVIVQKS